MLIAVGAFAAMDALLKILSGSYPTMQVSALRGAASLPFLVLPALFTGNVRKLKPIRWPWHLMRGVLQVVILGAFIYAVRLLTLADTYAIFLSAPLIVTALSAPLLKEHVAWRSWVAIGVGLCGVIAMLRPSGSNLMTFGALMALAAAVGYAFSALSLRILTRTEETVSVVLWPIVVMTAISSAIAIPNWVGIQPGHWVWIAAIGAVGALGTRMLTEAFRAAPAGVVAPFEYTALLWGVAIDWLVWSKLPSMRVVAGGALVISCGIYLIWHERQLQLAPNKAATGGSSATTT
jgi:drug/metabolite transporter (DMT)-like permease